mmetsp:Transcript_21426/g.29769  ORF Transcript_21426/g.29769 Transcript_21426/m.29769 type:complete len:225 (-) Transcript_21426:224-898(-)|eukprot:CAMPEP_0196583978 /NCGR_PEP_ID=MMETSP1081-20130531/45368_1 /TAXON_ID=36882 /ORGANISM="Pyramimonas amylifera, Strain CCMP720" /LENGTH=224 /DNA_ID=CAMNT_0041905027 /DNA_START=114 /DNA_END=788 /DNA_ORIENTATION=-
MESLIAHNLSFYFFSRPNLRGNACRQPCGTSGPVLKNPTTPFLLFNAYGPGSRRVRSSFKNKTAAASARTEEPSNVKVSVARQFYEQVWSKGDRQLAEILLAEDHVQHDRGWWGGRESEGREAMLRGIEGFRRAYPDLRFTVEDIQSSNDPLPSTCFVYWRASGTNLGGMFGKDPTKEPMDVSGISLLTINLEGQIQSSVVYRQATKEELFGALESMKPKVSDQ